MERAPANMSVKVPPELRDAMQHLAKARKQSTHAFMLEGLQLHVDNARKREAWRREGLEALEQYEQTGLHLTGDEVREWVAKNREETRESLPKCHG